MSLYVTQAGKKMVAVIKITIKQSVATIVGIVVKTAVYSPATQPPLALTNADNRAIIAKIQNLNV